MSAMELTLCRWFFFSDNRPERYVRIEFATLDSLTHIYFDTFSKVAG